jgi:6-pyruvoyltetrahydropterin/6-carboxytetrahydropterin synthase
LSQELVARLAPGLRRLGKGGYARGYRTKAGLMGTSTHQLVARLLDSMKIPYKERVKVDTKRPIRDDFLVNGTLVFVDRELDDLERRYLSSTGRNCVIIRRDSVRSDRLDHGIRILGLGERGNLQTIFLDDPSFNFDYAHILPRTRKCSVMHGHTSSVLVEVVGHPVDGMVVDFGIAKEIVREAVGSLDHKLFINRKYVTRVDPKSVTLRFNTVHGPFAVQAPKATTVLMPGEASVENLARELLPLIAGKMPENVTAVGVYVYEGLNKGAHILAQIHNSGARRRKKR